VVSQINKPRDIAVAFSKPFRSVCSSCLVTFTFIDQSTEMLSLAPVSNSDVHNATKWLRPTKSVGLNGIPDFDTKGFPEIFVLVPVLKIFFLILAYFKVLFPTCGTKQLLSLFSKKEKLTMQTKTNSLFLVRMRTIQTERPPHVGEVSANFC
jgi:hypothetical protein